MKLHRVLALVLRHLYLYKRSLARFMEVFYFPLLDILLWGFLTIYLQRFPGAVPGAVSFLLGALILWDILYRSQQGISLSFLEEVWSRNLLNLFVSPLTAGEFLAATMVLSLIKLSLTAAVTIALAWALYGYNFFLIGLALVPFVANLIVLGWSIGIVTTAIILRFGQKAEVMAWGLAFLFQPFSAVFYPVSVFPPGVREAAWFVPASHIFEGMRSVIAGGGFPLADLAWAGGLNAAYLLLALAYFYSTFRVVRERGLLLRVGE